MSPEWQLSIAYNAALRCATAALCAAGFRAKRERHHERTIQSLVHTMGLDKQTVETLDAFRRLRNVSDYDHVAWCQRNRLRRCWSWPSFFGRKWKTGCASSIRSCSDKCCRPDFETLAPSKTLC